MAATIRKTVVAPLGLITTPNQYGQFPEGALEIADGVLMRAAGELWNHAICPTQSIAGSVTADTIRQLMPLDAGCWYNFVQNGTTWYVYVSSQTSPGSATLPTLVSTTNLFNATRIFPVRARARMLVNSAEGVLVGDFMNPQNAGERALRMAGMPQAQISGLAVNAAATGAIPLDIGIAYGALFTREYADGYILRGVPSPIQFFSNNNGSGFPCTPSLTIAWASVGGGVLAGDFVELYRSDGLLDPSAGLDPDPGSTLKLVYRRALTSTDISNGFVSIVDRQQMTAPYYETPGRELYTNPGQEGSTGANRQPDINGAQAVFKGYTFYGNLTERPQLTFSVPAGFGDPAIGGLIGTYKRTFGVGYRAGLGTVAIGNPVITGVSAVDIIGVVVGQNLQTASFPPNTTVAAVGVNTITASAAAIGNNTAWETYDVIELNGARLQFQSAGDLIRAIAANRNSEVTLNQSIRAFQDVDGLVITVEPYRPQFSSTITARATNGANYSPPLPEITSAVQTFSQIVTPNLMRWSKDSEPEHVPAVNETRVGSGTIICFESTKDAMWISCTDGIYRLSGSAGNWVIDIIDPKCVLCSPQCSTVMRETVYAYTNRGFVRVTDAGIVPISEPIIRELMPGVPFSETAEIIVGSNESFREVFISLARAVSTAPYIYNEQNNAFTRISASTQSYSFISAMAFQDAPDVSLSTVGQILMASSNPASTPVVNLFESSPGASNYVGHNVRYRVFNDKSPMMLKQWIDITALFQASDAGKSLSVVSGTDQMTATATVVAVDAYVTGGVTRRNALSPSIRTGYTQASFLSTQTRFRGISLRYVPLTQQQSRR